MQQAADAEVALGRAGLRAEYERRLEERRRSHEWWNRWENRIADLRLVVFCVGLVLAQVTRLPAGTRILPSSL